MLALYIILGIIALFALLLALPLHIFVQYNAETGLQYRIKYAFLPIVDSTKEKKPKPEPKDEKPKEEKKPKEKKKSSRSAVGTLLSFLGMNDIASIANAKNAVSEKGICQVLADLGSAVKAIFARIFGLLRKGVFYRFDLNIVVGDEDAADAAMNYGRICAIVYPTVTMLDSAMKFKQRSVSIRCDFDEEETQVIFDGQLSYRPWHFVCFVFGMIRNYIKRSVIK